ncbi:MAG: hypothetical protein ABIQ32_05910 [Sphingomicrobium sp.]
MQFPSDIQAALLFDRRVACLDSAMRTFMRIEQARTGIPFNVVEAKSNIFYRLFGGGELMVTLEYVDGPTNPEVFQQTLSSTITGVLFPDVRQRLMTNRSHILVNVSHGALGSGLSPDIMKFLNKIDYRMEGQSLPEFQRRLEVCALISRIICDEQPPQAVHWTQSNQLIPGENFETCAQGDTPGPLHIHPYLFGNATDQDGKAKIGIRTFGARHFIGREILIEPSILPWAANYQTILAFLAVATTKNGYVIPDGDTFGPEDRSLSYRVLHREAEEGDVPLCELEPLMFREYNFVAEDYVPPERVFDDRSAPVDLMPSEDGDKSELISEWRQKRAMAEGIGGRFEVRARDPGQGSPPPAPPIRPGSPLAGVPGARPVFGRKRG